MPHPVSWKRPDPSKSAQLLQNFAARSVWTVPMLKRPEAEPLRSARFLTFKSVRWLVRNRAYTPWYLVRYWRFFRFKLINRHIITRGFIFMDRGVELYARKGYGRLILGRWIHLGVDTALRCHEGTLSLGDKSVLARDVSINCYLDVEIGDSALIADTVYISDFDHNFTNLTIPIKDQGISKSRVRIERDVWLGTKVTVCSGVLIGEGAVVGANAVVTGDLPAYAVAVGAPARMIKDRRAPG
jgi:acetyltransferase-like isoleucine patch superfamily enzyme